MLVSSLSGQGGKGFNWFTFDKNWGENLEEHFQDVQLPNVAQGRPDPMPMGAHLRGGSLTLLSL